MQGKSLLTLTMHVQFSKEISILKIYIEIHFLAFLSTDLSFIYAGCSLNFTLKAPLLMYDLTIWIWRVEYTW